ncbi:hypothetical protein ABE504_08945 [Paenibacillus oryzisoli]|uniref:hypothetical protein n=1 Tax=Paenibacillus oryzisoli TaxID=1850517 RepID=UPI003D294EE2
MTVSGIKDFIINGVYKELKLLEEKTRILKLLIRDDQAVLERKRMVWTRLGVVGQFQSHKLFEYDHEVLNDYLNSLGILPKMASIDSNLLTNEQLLDLEGYSTPGIGYVRYTPNFWGKIDCRVSSDKYNYYLTLPLRNKVKVWRDLFIKKEALCKIWEKERLQAVTAEEFQQAKKISLYSGSLSLQTTPIKYQAAHVLRLFGSKTLIQCARIEVEKFDEYAARGYLKLSDLSLCRKIIDVQERYYLMTLQAEEEKRKHWDLRLSRLSELSQLS